MGGLELNGAATPETQRTGNPAPEANQISLPAAQPPIRPTTPPPSFAPSKPDPDTATKPTPPLSERTRFYAPRAGTADIPPGAPPLRPVEAEWRPVDLSTHPGRQIYQTPGTTPSRNPSFLLVPSRTTPPEYTANNFAVLEAMGVAKGTPEPTIVRELCEQFRQSGRFKESPPPDAASLTVLLVNKDGSHLPVYLPLKPDNGLIPESRLPTDVSVRATVSAPGGDLGSLKGGLDFSTAVGTIGEVAKGPDGTSTVRTVVNSAGIGGTHGEGGPGGGVNWGTTSTTTQEFSGVGALSSQTTSIKGSVGFTPAGPSALISFGQTSQTLNSIERIGVSTGITPFGPVGSAEYRNDSLGLRASVNQVSAFGVQIPVPGAASLSASVITPNESHQLTINDNKAYFWGDGRGKEAFGLHGAFVPGLGGIVVPTPGPDAILPRSFELPTSVVQAREAKRLSDISVKYLGKPFGSTLETVRETLRNSPPPSFFPAEAAIHLFPPGDRPNQTALIENFKRLTGESALQSDGKTVKSSAELNAAVITWFEKNNSALIEPLKKGSTSDDPALRNSANRQLEALRQLAVAQVTDPMQPNLSQLQTLAQERQRLAQNNQPEWTKPWEQTAPSGIGYRLPTDKFSLGARNKVETKQEKDRSVLTAEVTVSVSIPDFSAPTSLRSQRTGLPDKPREETVAVTFRQEGVLSDSLNPLLAKYEARNAARLFETNALQKVSEQLLSAARQGGSIKETALSVLTDLPIESITPRGTVTAQQLSFRIPGRDPFNVQTSHAFELVKSPTGEQLIVVQVALESNRGGKPSITTSEQVERIPTDRPIEESIALVRSQLFTTSQRILKEAARNGMGALLRGEDSPAVLVRGFSPLSDGQSQKDKLASVVAAVSAQQPPIEKPAPTTARR